MYHILGCLTITSGVRTAHPHFECKHHVFGNAFTNATPYRCTAFVRENSSKVRQKCMQLTRTYTWSAGWSCCTLENSLNLGVQTQLHETLGDLAVPWRIVSIWGYRHSYMKHWVILLYLGEQSQFGGTDTATWSIGWSCCTLENSLNLGVQTQLHETLGDLAIPYKIFARWGKVLKTEKFYLPTSIISEIPCCSHRHFRGYTWTVRWTSQTLDCEGVKPSLRVFLGLQFYKLYDRTYKRGTFVPSDSHDIWCNSAGGN